MGRMTDETPDATPAPPPEPSSEPPPEPAVSTPPATPPASPTSPARRSRWRSVVAAVLVVLTAALAPLTVTAVWLHERILDANGYVDTVAPLAQNKVVTDALAQRVVVELFKATDLERRVADALPGPTDVLGPALTASLRGLATDQAEQFLRSDAFADLWVRANQIAHKEVTRLFTGRGKSLQQDRDKIVLDLGAVADDVRDELVKDGVTVLRRVPIPQNTIEVTIFQSDFVTRLQSTFALLDRLVVVLPVLFVVCLAGAIVASRRRRTVIVVTGVAVAATTALLNTGIDVGERITVDQVGSQAITPAAVGQVYDTLVSALRDWSGYLIAVALLVAVVALVADPTRIGRIAARLRGDGTEVPAGIVWLRANRALVLGGLTALGVLVLVVWPAPTFLVLAVVVVLTALALATAVALARMAPAPAAVPTGAADPPA